LVQGQTAKQLAIAGRIVMRHLGVALRSIGRWSWRRFLRWPRPLVYKVLVVACLIGAAVEAGYILVFAPPPYVVVSGAAGAPPTAIPTLTPTSPPKNPGDGPAIVVPTATPVPTVTATPTAVPMRLTAQIVTEPDDGAAPLVAFIDGARSSLDGEIYLLSDPLVLAAFAQSEARGVRVQLILEQHPFGGDVSSPSAAYAYLTAHGVGVRWGGAAFRFTHAKALVADRTRAWIGRRAGPRYPTLSPRTARARGSVP